MFIKLTGTRCRIANQLLYNDNLEICTKIKCNMGTFCKNYFMNYELVFKKMLYFIYMVQDPHIFVLNLTVLVVIHDPDINWHQMEVTQFLVSVNM